MGNGSEGTISHQKLVFLSRHCTRGTCTITFIYGIQSVHEMSAGMNLEFVFSFNRIHCNYCHSANDRVFVLGWGIGWCCRPGWCSMAGACGVCCSMQHYKQVDFSPRNAISKVCVAVCGCDQHFLQFNW